jgi:hypothetical protein
MLGLLIARQPYLRDVTMDGGRLFIRRGRRLYQLHEAGSRPAGRYERPRRIFRGGS